MAYIYVQISRIDGRIRELEDECYRLVSEGHGSTLVIRFRIEKMEALRAKLISRYLQQQQNDDGGRRLSASASASSRRWCRCGELNQLMGGAWSICNSA